MSFTAPTPAPTVVLVPDPASPVPPNLTSIDELKDISTLDVSLTENEQYKLPDKIRGAWLDLRGLAENPRQPNENLIIFLRYVNQMLNEALPHPGVTKEQITTLVEAIDELFAVGKGDRDIQLDYRRQQELLDIENILTEILKKPWPEEKKFPEKLTEYDANAVLSDCKRACRYLAKRVILGRQINPRVVQEQIDARAVLEAVVDKVRNARISGQKEGFKKLTVEQNIRKIVSYILISLGSLQGVQTTVSTAKWAFGGSPEGQTAPEIPRTSPTSNVNYAAEAFRGFNVVSSGRKVSITIPPGYTLNESLTVLMGEPNGGRAKGIVVNPDGTYAIPTTIQPNGGTLFFTLRVRTPNGTEVFHNDFKSVVIPSL